MIEQIIVFIIDDLLNAKKILKKISFQIDEKKIYFLNVFFEYLKAPNHFYLKTKIFLLNFKNFNIFFLESTKNLSGYEKKESFYWTQDALKSKFFYTFSHNDSPFPDRVKANSLFLINFLKVVLKNLIILRTDLIFDKKVTG